MPAVQETVEQVRRIDVDQYKYGFVTDIESDKAPKGLNEDIVRFISAKKNEPEWMLDWRLEAYRRWLTMDEPTWAQGRLSRRSTTRTSTTTPRRRARPGPKSPRRGRSGNPARPTRSSAFRCASRRCWPASSGGGRARASRSTRCSTRVSVATTFKEELEKAGVIFCSISEAIREHPGAGEEVSRLGRAGHATITSPR